MASQPAGRRRRPATRADVESDERRGWLSHGLAALGISALGLAIAGSISLTTSAQPLPVKDSAPARPASTASAPTTEPSRAQAAAPDSYAPRGAAGQGTQGTALRGAVLREQAAQRAEELAKSADDITRAAQTASSDARQDKLDAADAASAKAAALLAEQRLRKAVAARVAAALEREASEREASEREASEREASEGKAAPRRIAQSRPAEPAPDRGAIPTAGGGGGASPVPGAVIGARWRQYGIWSRWHTGIDFRAAYGTPIRAVRAGVVVFAGNSGDWAGNHVAVRHGDGLTTMSSHMSSMAVSSGQSVAAGQVIGYVGQTGRAFGAHLHFELYPAGVRPGDVYKTIDPQPWLAAAGVRTN